jgi:hypothetical protein
MSLNELCLLILTNEIPIIRVEVVYKNSGEKDLSAIICGVQENTFFIQDAEFYNDMFVPTDQIFGKSYEHYWMVGKNIVKIAKIGDETGEAKEIKNAVEAKVSRAKSLLRIGVSHLDEVGTMISTNRFIGSSHKFGAILGQIINDNGGVLLSYKVSSQANREYKSKIDSFVCNSDKTVSLQFDRSSVQDGKVFNLGNGKLINLNLGTTNLSLNGGYVPSMFVVSQSPKALFLMASNKSFAISANGEAIELPKPGVAPDGKLLSSPIVIACVASIILGLNGALILWLKNRAGKKTQNAK